MIERKIKKEYLFDVYNSRIVMQYYGIALGITSVSESWSPYLMFLVSSIAEIIGYAICHLNDRFSRKKVLVGFLASASVVCFIVAVNKAQFNISKYKYIFFSVHVRVYSVTR